LLPLIIVIVYFIAMIALGLSTRKQARSAGSYFVAGRSGSTLFITGSLLATIIGASATIGMAGLGFARGLTGAWWILSGSVGWWCWAFFLRVRSGNTVFTLYPP